MTPGKRNNGTARRAASSAVRFLRHPVRLGAALALTAALLLALCGCHRARSAQADPAALLQKAEAAMERTPCTRAVLEVTMQLTLDGVEATTVNTNEITVTRSPVSSRILTDTAVTAGGTTTHTTAQAYSVPKGQLTVTYVEDGGVWLAVSGQEQLSMSLSASALTADTDTLALDESVTEWEGRPVCCLTTRLHGEALRQLLSGVIGTMAQNSAQQDGTSDAASGEEIGCEARILLDAETYLPICEEMTFTGMSEALKPLYPVGTLEVRSCTAVDRFVSYGTQDPIRLPEGAEEKAAAWQRLLLEEPENGDGSFTLREGTVLADILTPAGFSLAEKAYDHVTFARDDHRQAAYTVYYLTDGADGESFRALADADAARWTQNGGTVERGQMQLPVNGLDFDCEVLDTAWSGHTERCVYAWALLDTDADGSYYLLVKVTDGYADGLGGVKSADITGGEYAALLSCASRSRFMD